MRTVDAEREIERLRRQTARLRRRIDARLAPVQMLGSLRSLASAGRSQGRWAWLTAAAVAVGWFFSGGDRLARVGRSVDLLLGLVQGAESGRDEE